MGKGRNSYSQKFVESAALRKIELCEVASNSNLSVLSVDSQVASSPIGWRKMPLPSSVEINSIHEHPLNLFKDYDSSRQSKESMSVEHYESACWSCNGVDIFKDGCKGNITDFGLHPNMKVWQCV